VRSAFMDAFAILVVEELSGICRGRIFVEEPMIRHNSL
jgi:hypothetical protein